MTHIDQKGCGMAVASMGITGWEPGKYIWPEKSTWSNWQPTYYWPQPLSGTVTKFKGALKALVDLPENANSGDAYFIEKDGILVVRVYNGWHHFDRE